MKLKTAKLISLAILISVNVFSQEFWEEIPFNVPNCGINTFTVTSDGAIIAGAINKSHKGLIFRSTDKGNTWQKVYPDSVPLHHFYLNFDINDQGHIYACAKDKYVIVSKDNGLTWNKLNTNYPISNLNKICCKGNDTLYITVHNNSGAKLMYSYDSGATWELSVIDEIANSNITDIEVANNNDIYVATGVLLSETYKPKVYRSSDNCNSWDSIHICETSQANSNCEVSNIMTLDINSNGDVFILIGISEAAAAPDNNILVKKNDEETFRHSRLYGLPEEGECMAVDSNNIIYIFQSNKLFVSRDFGEEILVHDLLNNALGRLQAGADGYLYGCSVWYPNLVKSKFNSNSILLQSDEMYGKQPNIALYPNPSNDILKIALDSKLRSGTQDVKIDIYSTVGDCVHSSLQKLHSDNIEVNISNLSSGIYTITVSTNDKHYSSKFVKL
ncbi:MAG: T9SS type A sorting domain-containing protein [Bacteroidales bacterium]|jgi:hypothetical protein